MFGASYLLYFTLCLIFFANVAELRFVLLPHVPLSPPVPPFIRAPVSGVSRRRPLPRILGGALVRTLPPGGSVCCNQLLGGTMDTRISGGHIVQVW
jgi:hypothetical protein